ncbi:hypothetical protein BDP27DRAFT_1417299 [Rhodocollybia butyracea]|uniref:Uncharacterized protein n=1 Tax=Rhodocollybia butyracea TaxID=206335 RepID=A0A9P5Q1J6_9AGAR|nr:hypothetical protein BDP27DRAFT_1417299 [Rhodocollybia butyracea]
MLLPHRWLGVVLLAVLISPACAAPTPTPPPATKPIKYQYTVTVVKNDGSKAKTIPQLQPSVQDRIKKLIFEMGDELGDGKDPNEKSITWDIPGEKNEGKKTDMVYSELQGSNFAPKNQKCYGYTVSIDAVSDKGKTTRQVKVGAIITRNLSNTIIVVDYMAQKQDFEPVKEWKKQIDEWEKATDEQKKAMKAEVRIPVRLHKREYILGRPKGSTKNGPPRAKRPHSHADAAPPSSPDAAGRHPAPQIQNAAGLHPAPHSPQQSAGRHPPEKVEPLQLPGINEALGMNFAKGLPPPAVHANGGPPPRLHIPYQLPSIEKKPPTTSSSTSSTLPSFQNSFPPFD